MNLRSSANGFGLLWFCFLLLCIPFSVNAQTLVVAPFENSTSNPDYQWVGEALAEGLTEYLNGQGVRLISREERVEALDRLGLPPAGSPSQASLLRMAEELEADWLAMGEFELTGQKLVIRARLLDMRRLQFSQSFQAEGSFAGLQDIAVVLAWQFLRQLYPAFHLGREEFRRRFEPVSVSAFESYLRGLLATNRAQQIQYWLQAARLAPDYSPPAYQLGRSYLEAENYSDAEEWLGKISLGDKYGPDARFHLALSQFYQGEPAKAVDTLRPLADRLPVQEVWKNLAVFASRAGSPDANDFFENALAGGDADLDLRFNQGLHHLRNSRPDKAASEFSFCLELNPMDTEARFLLAKALMAGGRAEEARSVEQQAVGDNPALRLSLENRMFEMDRAETRFSSSLARNALQKREAGLEPTARAQHLDVHLERGREFMAQGDWEQAREEFVQAILLAPASYDGHVQLAELYQREGREQEAISELRAALWSRDTAEARLRLARIYLKLGRELEAMEQVRAALAVEPKNRAARRLHKQLKDGKKKKRTSNVN